MIPIFSRPITISFSQAIIYGVFTLANFFAPPIVAKLKPKWSMVAASLFYALFEAGFLFLNEAFLYVTSALLGMAAAGTPWSKR